MVSGLLSNGFENRRAIIERGNNMRRLAAKKTVKNPSLQQNTRNNFANFNVLKQNSLIKYDFNKKNNI